jgi:hypothetical protein
LPRRKRYANYGRPCCAVAEHLPGAAAGANNRWIWRGCKEVRINQPALPAVQFRQKIIGSLGRCSDFDRASNPLKGARYG